MAYDPTDAPTLVLTVDASQVLAEAERLSHLDEKVVQRVAKEIRKFAALVYARQFRNISGMAHYPSGGTPRQRLFAKGDGNGPALNVMTGALRGALIARYDRLAVTISNAVFYGALWEFGHNAPVGPYPIGRGQFRWGHGQWRAPRPWFFKGFEDEGGKTGFVMAVGEGVAAALAERDKGNA